ncbi:MAG TPA: ATP-binding cassette domain-containing protein [Kofleriaceae bacterium]|nr:ATP-binding cassette domain-containing protein [Kofleriaceae bacterium]
MPDAVIEVRDLHFRYRGAPREVLTGVDLRVERGTRALVIGANGAGKTTLLRMIAGKHMVSPETVRVLGRSAFHDTDLAAHVELLGGNFPFEVDLRVAELLKHGVGVDPARRDRLIELLGVDPQWHMHAVSDGQRRRVQLLLGLMRPRQVLLLDEITTDLDLVARQDLLAFLREESEERGVTILYATHIFDSLEEWATHIIYVVGGRIALAKPIGEVDLGARLVHVVDGWLRRDAAPRAKIVLDE